MCGFTFGIPSVEVVSTLTCNYFKPEFWVVNLHLLILQVQTEIVLKTLINLEEMLTFCFSYRVVMSGDFLYVDTKKCQREKSLSIILFQKQCSF